MNTINTAIEVIYSLNLNELVKTTISSPLAGQKYKKIVINRHLGFFQASCYFENKITHKNYRENGELLAALVEWLGGYKQFDFRMTNEDILILASKSGNVKIRRGSASRDHSPTAHNRARKHIILEGESLLWLHALGITTDDGKVKSQMQKKFRQINRFLEIIADVAHHLPDRCHIIDAGCGKSYLTFAVWHYLNNIAGKKATITGIDLKADVVAGCQALADKLSMSSLHFVNASLESYAPASPPDMLISLHACDTATDHAIAAAIRQSCKVILAAPCCQHEAISQLANPMLAPILKHGIFKEKIASSLTDGLRTLMLEAKGYKAAAIEFVDPEHTPKNLLIRAVKIHPDNPAALAHYNEITHAFNLNLTLNRLLDVPTNLSNEPIFEHNETATKMCASYI